MHSEKRSIKFLEVAILVVAGSIFHCHAGASHPDPIKSAMIVAIRDLGRPVLVARAYDCSRWHLAIEILRYIYAEYVPTPRLLFTQKVHMSLEAQIMLLFFSAMGYMMASDIRLPRINTDNR